MISKSYQDEINTIEYEWRHLSQEPDDDPESFLFISIHSTALKLRIHNLHALLKKQIETNKETKLAYQMLVNSLGKMESLLDFKAKSGKGLNSEHIKNIMAKIKSIEPEIEILKKHVTD